MNCLLCNSPDSHVIQTIKTDDIIKAYQSIGHHLGDRALGDLKSYNPIYKYKCSNCGFEFHDPRFAGSAAFYARLQEINPDYYPKICFSFEKAIHFAHKQNLSHVLDLGCGLGYFLDSAKKWGLQTEGIELNETTIKPCQDKGHSVHHLLIEDFIDQFPNEKYPFVTSFEVLEHVPDPRSFFSNASNLLQDGGFLAVSVPSKYSLNYIHKNNPFNLPPHHLSHWRKNDLKFLSDHCGLKLVKIEKEPLKGWNMKHFLLGRNTINQAISQDFVAIPPKLISYLSFIYRKTGMKYFFPRWGISMVAFFKKV